MKAIVMVMALGCAAAWGAARVEDVGGGGRVLLLSVDPLRVWRVGDSACVAVDPPLCGPVIRATTLGAVLVLREPAGSGLEGAAVLPADRPLGPTDAWRREVERKQLAQVTEYEMRLVGWTSTLGRDKDDESDVRVAFAGVTVGFQAFHPKALHLGLPLGGNASPGVTLNRLPNTVGLGLSLGENSLVGLAGCYSKATDGEDTNRTTGLLLTGGYFFEDGFQGPWVSGALGFYSLKGTGAGGTTAEINPVSLLLTAGWRLRGGPLAAGLGVGVQVFQVSQVKTATQTLGNGFAVIMPQATLDVSFTF